MRRLTVMLAENELTALLVMATEEMRDPRDQARFLICQALKRRGLLREEKSDECPETLSEEKTKRGDDGQRTATCY